MSNDCNCDCEDSNDDDVDSETNGEDTSNNVTIQLTKGMMGSDGSVAIDYEYEEGEDPIDNISQLLAKSLDVVNNLDSDDEDEEPEWVEKQIR